MHSIFASLFSDRGITTVVTVIMMTGEKGKATRFLRRVAERLKRHPCVVDQFETAVAGDVGGDPGRLLE